MNKMLRVLACGMLSLLTAAEAFSQDFAATGTRAAGMGGAFVGVADDATAIYWNPAGLAAGSYFSLVLDGTNAEAIPDAALRGAEKSSYFMGLAIPALGLGYYRLQAAHARPAPSLLIPVLPNPGLTAADSVQVDTLVTHHGGLSLVQSLWQGVAIGTTVKFVRGIAASTRTTATNAEDALDSDAAEIFGLATNKFDLDVGIMAAGGPLKLGLTLRNVLEPGFAPAGGGPDLVLDRQARAGMSFAVTPKWIAAADVDLLRTRDAFGDRRDVAFGTEGRLASSLFVRAGASFNTVGGDLAERQAFSVGGSYAVRTSIFIDGHYTTGNDNAGQQWGIAARFVY
jgi:hypothetical protein